MTRQKLPPPAMPEAPARPDGTALPCVVSPQRTTVPSDLMARLCQSPAVSARHVTHELRNAPELLALERNSAQISRA